MNDTYALSLSSFSTAHFPASTLFVGDYAAPGQPEVDARVRSGDYFILLATSLDSLAAEITETSPAATSVALAKLAEELEYVQKRYAIVRKAHPDELTELH